MTLRSAAPVALLIAALTAPALAGDFGARPLRYGYTGGSQFDARSDDRDFPTNGFFPGNFAVNPGWAFIGAAGFLGSAPYRSPLPYPSQVYFGSGTGRVHTSAARGSQGSDLIGYAP